MDVTVATVVVTVEVVTVVLAVVVAVTVLVFGATGNLVEQYVFAGE